MSITVGKFTFNGPYISTDNLEDMSGVYAIHCKKNEKYYLLDVGESAEVKSRVENHDRKDCWKRNCDGTINYSVLYTLNKQQAGRMEIEEEIRNEYNPVCGKR